MAIVGEVEAPVGGMDATLDPKIGSGRALDTAGFRPHAKPGKKADEGAFTGKVNAADGVDFTGKKAKGKKAKAGGESSGKIVSSGFAIPGLRTSESVKQKEFDDSINQLLIHLQITLPTKIELSSYQKWYLLYGKFDLKDLAERVCVKVNLEVGCPMRFAADSVVLPDETKVSALLKKYEGEDGFIHLFCDIGQDPLNYGWITVERKKKKFTRNACPLTRQQTPRKTGPLTDMTESKLVIEAAPYLKLPSFKTNGTRKMSQFFKKRQMKFAMTQKSAFIQTNLLDYF